MKQKRKTNKRKKRKQRRKTYRRHGGDYTMAIKDTFMDIPVLDEDSDELTVTVPGFGVMSLRAFKQYQEDRDRNGYRSG